MFNKKFEDKYPNVSKPIICNGLKEIIPYKGQKKDNTPTSGAGLEYISGPIP